MSNNSDENKNLNENPATEEQENIPGSGNIPSAEDALQQQVADLKDQLLRMQAEMQNTRRRAQEDVSKAHKFGIETFAEHLLPVKDSLEAALKQEGQSFEVLLEGVTLTLRQLSSAFERNKLLEIAPEVGATFDPNVHQAISTLAVEGKPAGTIVDVLQKGYKIADRVLRPALVVVAA